MGHLLTALARIAGATTLAIGAPAGNAQAADERPPGIGIRLVDVPVATADNPRARSYIIDHVAPGTVIERRVEVSNGTTDTAQVSMYPGAAQIRDGAFAGADGRTQNELSNWVTVSPGEPVVDPQEETMVNVTITVPEDASRGERYGVIWAETRNAPEDGGVTQVTRVGIRIYLSVGPGGAPPSDFAIASLTAARDSNGRPLLHAMVRNTGERALDMSAKVKLSDGPGGLSAGPFTSASATTLGIGQTAPVTVKLAKQLPDGPWLARIAVTSGLDQRTAQARVSFPTKTGESNPVPVPAEAEGTPWWVWVIAALVLLILLLVALVVVHHQRRSKSGASPEGP